MASFKEEKRLILLFGFALALRLIMVKWTYVMANDGVVYISMARDLFSGDFAAFSRENSHPLYPLMLGAVQKIVYDWELSGKIVSAITGSLLVIPFYLWGRANIGERTALYSTLFLAVNPYHVRYSADVITESTYVLFFFLAVIFSIDAASRKKVSLFACAGLFIGLAYLTRPEGIILLLPLMAWTLFIKFPAPKLKIAALSVLIVAVVIVALPYMLYLRSNYGKWLITGKYDVSRITGMQESPGVAKPVSPGTSAEDMEKQKHPAGKSARRLYTGIMNNLDHLAYLGKRFAETYHPLMTLLLLYGIVRKKIAWAGKKANIYLLAVLLIYASILFRMHMVYQWFDRRHILPLAVLALYWAGAGFAYLVESLKKYSNKEKGALNSHHGKIAALCLIILMAMILPKSLKPQRVDKLSEKRVGIWLKETNIEPPSILTNIPRVAFYAEGINHDLNKVYFDNLINYMQEHNVDYIVLNDKVEDIYSDFITSDQIRRLELILKAGEEKEEKVLVYRLK